MTTPSEALPAPHPEPAEGRERRLHPWSWLFVLLIQLKQFALPLLVLLFTGRGDSNEFWPMIGVGVLAVVSVAQYFTYRYRIGAEGLTIRSGLFQRTVRHIPFDRVHNVALQQTVLHRLFGVAEVRLESAGGTRPEASMRVLSLHDAQALEQRVRDHARPTAAASAPDAQAPPVLALGAGELLRLGLISNRGMLVVAAVFGFAAQGDSKLFAEVVTMFGEWVMSWSEQLHLGTFAMVGGAVLLMLVAIVVLRLFSIAIAFLQFHGFVLHDHDGRLHVQRGLLTRLRGSLPRTRIQAFLLKEGFLHRRFGRRSLDVDTMAQQNDAEGKGSLRHLVPIATPETMDAIVSRLLPRAAWPPSQWQALPARTWVRLFVPGAVFWFAAAAAFAYRFGAIGWLVALGVPWAAFSAQRWVANAAYTVDEGLVVVREGWLDRSWRFAELGKVQGLRLARSPVDRRCGTASLLLDTAGIAPGNSGLRLRFLPLPEAQALYARLAGEIAKVPVATGRRVIRARSGATAAPAP